MGAVFERMVNMLFSKKLEVVLVGLENSGKTTLLNVLSNGAPVETAPTIGLNVKLVKRGGYAVFVVGDLRDNKGYQKDFTGITKQAFIKAGMKLYNELILVEPVGTKAMTLERGFKNGKLAKVHQNVYIFKKP